MEKKRTQRIIGILVVIALVIIVMPLLFGKNDAPTQEAANTTKAPPFPDQQQATTTASNSTTQDVTTAANTVKTDAAATVNANADTTASTNLPTASPTPAAATQQDTAPVLDANQPAAASAPEIAKADSSVIAAPAEQPSTTTAPNAAEPKKDVNTIEITPDVAKSINGSKEAGIIYDRPKPAEQAIKTDAAVATTETKETAQPSAVKVDVSKPASVQKADNQSVSTLKLKHAVMQQTHKTKTVKSIVAKNKKTVDQLSKTKTAWAIQMGNFKVKQNAVNLANKLRASGYKAFTREIKSAQGHISTRVYIGPEFKQASAAKLSNDVQHHLNMQGLVIPYKPLEI